MGLFLSLGIAGLALLATSSMFDGFLDAVDGPLDGWLSFPLVAGFISMLGFTGAIVLGSTGLGTGAAAAAGAVAGFGAGWLAWRLSRALSRHGGAVAPHQDDLLDPQERSSPPSPPTGTARSCSGWPASP